MLRKTNGNIFAEVSLEEYSLSELLLPCFFLGQTEDLDPWEIVEDRYTPLRIYSPDMKLAEGQFLLGHQYASTNCSNTVLSGIFLPLRTCQNPKLLEGLLEIVEHACTVPDSQGENDAIRRIHNQLAAVGPMKLSSIPMEAREALLRFTNPEEMYPWLRDHFEYVLEFGGMSNDDAQTLFDAIPGLNIKANDFQQTWSFRDRSNVPRDALDKAYVIMDTVIRSHSITRTARMPWNDFKEFSAWVNPKGIPVKLRAALVYENSD